MNDLQYRILLFVVYAWSIAIKGVALWRAGKSEQRNWFVAILILNTLGIIELVYLFRFAKKRLTIAEVQSWMPSSKKK